MARILFFVLAVVILFTGLSWMRTSASEDHIQPATGYERVISVDMGDTLWSVVSSMKKDSMDTREAIHILMKRNDLDSSVLQSGQMLIVPEEILPS